MPQSRGIRSYGRCYKASLLEGEWPVSTEVTHSWVRARLASHAAGLLSDADGQLLHSHRAHCAACQGLWEAYVGGDGDVSFDGEHLPPSLLARWAETSSSLQGMARTMVRGHLERCAECRDDLRLLGHDSPLMDLQAGLAAEAVEQRQAPPAQLAKELAARTRVTQRSRLAWWGLGGWAALATAALVALVWWPRGERESGDGPTALPWVAPALTRGAASDASLEISSQTQRVIVAVPVAAALTNTPQVRVRIFGPDGALMVSLRLSPQDLQRRTAMVPLELPEPRLAGIYRVVLDAGADDSATAPPAERYFELRAATP